MENKNENLPQEKVENNEQDVFNRVRNTIGRAVLVGTAIVGGQIVTTENALAETSELEFTESYEMQFQRMLIQNEILFNQELAKLNIPLVKFGPSVLVFRCASVQFGIYSENGEHIMDSSCTFKQFNNKYEFIELAKKKIIPRLVAKYGVTTTEPVHKTILPRLSPEKLLKIARFDNKAINFFEMNDLTLVARVVSNKDKSQEVSYVCIERKKNSRIGYFREDICYDDSTLQSDFTYLQKLDIVRIEIINQDGSKQSFDLQSEYTKDGKLSGFR